MSAERVVITIGLALWIARALDGKENDVTQPGVAQRRDVLDEVIQRVGVDAQHTATSDVGSRAIPARSILGNGDEHHFLRPTGNLPADQYVPHHVPRSPRHDQRVALRHDEIGRGRK